MTASIAPVYRVLIRDTRGVVSLWLDDWRALEYQKAINTAGYYAITLPARPDWQNYFILDAIIEIQRAVPGAALNWYTDFIGLQRTANYTLSTDGRYVAVFSGVCPMELLSRRVIGYDTGSPGAHKGADAETVIKSYVWENAGLAALVTNGRIRDAVLPGFMVAPSLGRGNYYEADKAWENLYDVVRDVADFASMDFCVAFSAPNIFTFDVYPGQLGIDRTWVGIDPATGLNLYGNIPMHFSLQFANIADLNYALDHSKEATVSYVTGTDGVSRIIKMSVGAEAIASPWNDREIAVDHSEQSTDLALQTLATENLLTNGHKEDIDFTPLHSLVCLYGKNYDLGDRVSINYLNTLYHRRITSIKVSFAEGREAIDLGFTEKSQ